MEKDDNKYIYFFFPGKFLFGVIFIARALSDKEKERFDNCFNTRALTCLPSD